jgi:hypothetical protein
VELGMKKSEFYAHTVALLSMMLRLKDKLRVRECDYPAGVVGSVIANVNRDPEKRPDPFEPWDIIGSLQPPEDRPEQTPEEVVIENANFLLAKSMGVFAGLKHTLKLHE